MHKLIQNILNSIIFILVVLQRLLDSESCLGTELFIIIVPISIMLLISHKNWQGLKEFQRQFPLRVYFHRNKSNKSINLKSLMFLERLKRREQSARTLDYK